MTASAAIPALPRHFPYASASQAAYVARVRSGAVRVTVDPDELFRGELRPYQHVGVTTMALTKRLVIADMTGLGKTVQTLRYLALLVRLGVVTPERPAFVVVPPNVLESSWLNDGFRVFVPELPVQPLTGDVPPRERARILQRSGTLVYLYNSPCFIRDQQVILAAHPRTGVLIADEGSDFRNHSTRLAEAMTKFATTTDRRIVATATPVQTSLMDLHSILTVLGLEHVFGKRSAFRDRHFRTVLVERRIPGGRLIRRREPDRLNPHAHMDELQRKLWPYYLRRTYRDLGPGEMPELSHRVEWLDLPASQRAIYERIRTGPKVQPGGGFNARLRARATLLRQAATATRIVDHPRTDHSVKLDWLLARLTGDWTEGGVVESSTGARPTKVVVYSSWREGVMATAARLDAAGIGFVVMAGEGDLPSGQPFPYGTPTSKREPLRKRFFEDGDCQVCIGTSALEMGLNLHAAPVLVALDTLSNPARMSQLVGRIWRASSPFRFVQAIQLLTRGTVEEGILQVLAQRQGVIDAVNGDTEDTDVLASLTTAELERLVATDWNHR